MASRAWARAICLLPLLLSVVVAQPVQTAAAAHPPATAAGPRHMLTYNNAGLSHEVFGYAYGASLADPTVGYPSWNFDLLSTVAFFAIGVNNQGILTADSNWTVWNSSALSGLVSTAHAHGVKVVVTLRSGGAELCGALYGYQSTVDQIVAQVQAKGVDGVNIDYEGQLATCTNPNAGGTNYTNQWLLTNLARALRGKLDSVRPGYYLSIATYSGSAAGNDGFFNIPDLNQYVDSFFVMAYDMDYSNQGSGPLAGCPYFCMTPVSPIANYTWNDSTSMSQYISVVGASKTILGQPYYGRVACVGSPVAHATNTGQVQAATYLDSVAALTSPDVKPGTYAIHRDASDPAGLDRWDTWYDNALGCWREMYWSDTATLSTRYDLVNQYNLRGVGIWTLSYAGGAAELWNLLQTKFVYCANTSAAANPTSPQLSGTAIQVTASTSYCANPRYEFWMKAPGGAWTLVQPYSTNNVFNWNTLGRPFGSYWFSVWARDAHSPGQWGNAPNSYDSYSAFQYQLTTQPCTSVTASAAPASPQLMGTSVTVSATSAGCPSPNYQFWLRAPGSSTWRVVQAYSPTASFTWNTAGWTPGDYGVAVWARDTSSLGTSSGGLGSWDALTSTTYSLSTSPCAGVSAAFSPASPQLSGTTVTVTATASGGCPSPNYQFWVLAPGSSTWRVAHAYSGNASLSWSTLGNPKGVYSFSVWVRDSSSLGKAGNSLGTWDAYASGQYQLTSQPCTTSGATSAPPGNATVGTTVTITGSASGCPAPQYEFWMMAPGSSTWVKVQGYSPTATLTWDTTGKAKGLYHFIVMARDQSSTGTASSSAGTWDSYSTLSYTLS